MDITITLSDAAEKVVREKAEETGKDVENFVEEFIEESFSNDNGGEPIRKRKLSEFAGMFSGGLGGTAERASEILRAEMGLSSLDRD